MNENLSYIFKIIFITDNSHEESAFELSTSATTVEHSEFTAEPSTSTFQLPTSTVESATIAPQPSTSTYDLSNTPLNSNLDENSQLHPSICIFCDKCFKKHQGQRQQLVELDKQALMKSLEKYEIFIKDTETYDKIQKSATLFNHRICRKNYFNKLREFEEKKETNFHKNLQLHKEAFSEICNFIDENVINNKKFYSFGFMCNNYLQIISNIAADKGEKYNNVFSKAHFENKLKKKYEDNIQILVVHNKKIVGPKGYLVNHDLFSVIEKSDVLQNAALILRRTILDMKRTPLPENISTSDLLKGECSTPQILKDFYATILRGHRFKKNLTNECERKSQSLAEDLIFNASHGRIKPAKHITLAMTLKSITSSRKVVEIVNRYGHCCSYHTIEELETEASFSSTSRSSSCPEGITLADGFCTGVAFDNFDRFVDTPSGKNTLHDTVGIIYQNVQQVEVSEDDVVDDVFEEIVPKEIEDNNDNERSGNEGNSNQKQKKQRRRKFEAIIPELQPFAKKLRLSETLLSVSDERRSVTVSSLLKIQKLDVIFMLSHAFKIPNTPMWVGFNSQVVEDMNTTRQKICYLTPINESPTAKNVVLETLKESQKIAKEVKQSEIAVTYDLAIAKIAMQIQSEAKPLLDNVFIHLGSFHIMLAYFKAVGKFISDCGLMNVAVESGIIASGSVDSFISGKHFNRCKRLHPLMALGLEILHFQFFLRNEKIIIPENLESELTAFKNQKLSYDDLMSNSDVSAIISTYSAFKKDTLSGAHGVTPKFYMTYINLVSYYEMLSRSIRAGDFALFKYILPRINNLFFVLNQPNYARWLVRYHENLIKLEETHPQLYASMEKGHFGIQRTNKSFSRQPIDLTLEQTINADAGRRLTGVIHFTNSISARQRWCRSHEIRSTIISHTYEVTGLRKHTDVTADLESYNIKKDSKHLQSFIDTFSKFINPFDIGMDKLQLFNISSGKAATQAVQDYLVNIEENGQNLREQFITKCTNSPNSFEDPISKVKIMNFSYEVSKKTINSGNKVQEVKMQRDLFGRLLGLSLDYEIDMEYILSYPVTPLPMSMCRLDGSIYQTDKSTIVKCFEKEHKVSDAPNTFHVVIVDGFFLLHTMHDIPATFGGISKKIMSILTSFKAKRVDVVFDQYFSPSIKDYERTRRNEQKTIDFNILGPSQTRPIDFMKELKNIKFKESLVQFLIQHWATDEMATFIGNTLIKVNYDLCYSYIVKNNVVEMAIDEDINCNNHEEADTKIIHHVCKLDTYEKTNVLLKTSDTDVLIIMLGNMDHLESDDLNIFMEYGTGNSKRYIHVTKLYMELGPNLCTSLPGFHALTGCDYNPSFFKKGKIRPYQILKKNQRYQQALTDLGAAHITGLRDEIFHILEEFICEIYKCKNISNINTARFQKFCQIYKAVNKDEPFIKTLRNGDPSMLPPSKAEVLQHLLRTQYITSIWRNAYLRFPTSLSPERNGWTLHEEKLDFHWFDGDCIPLSVFETVICEKNKENNIANVTAGAYT